MVRPESHSLNLRIHCHFERKEHVLPLIAQPKAPEPIHTPHVQVLVTRHGAHVKETRVH